MRLSLDAFNDLKRGDQIEGSSVFKRLSEEPVVLLTITKSKTRAEFAVSWMGVSLGRCECHVLDGELQWQV